MLKKTSKFEEKKISKKNFGNIYSRYYNCILNYIKRRINNKSYSEDLASEVFERAYRSIDDFKWQGVSIKCWIYRIARNLLTDYYRKVGRVGENISLSEIENSIKDEGATIDMDLVRSEEDVVLYNALREFRDSDQYLIFYKFFENLSNREISQIMKISETCVSTKLYRIRKKLKKILLKNNAFKR